jgi:hypothetical protein
MSWRETLASVAVITLVITNLSLIFQNREIKNGAAPRAATKYLDQGEQFPPIDGLLSSGRHLRIDFDRRRTLFIVFSPGCHWCRENRNFWDEVLQSIDREKFRPVGLAVSSDGLSDFMEGTTLSNMEVIELTPSGFLTENSFNYVPQILIVNSSGLVERSWIGSLDESRKGDLSAALGIRPRGERSKGGTP